MELENVFLSIMSERAVLFLGAGFSASAINHDGEEIFTGGKLLAKLKKYISLQTSSTDLPRIAQRYKKERGGEELVKLLKKKFTVKRVEDEHRYITELPWKCIYTTNYDNVVEVASSERIIPKTLSDEVSLERNICVHLNGYVDNVTEEALDSELKLTSSSYDIRIDSSPWIKRLQAEIDAAKVVVFIGYSLPDLDVRRILVEKDSNKEKCIFIDQDNIDPLVESELDDFGYVYKKGLKKFVNELKKCQENYVLTDEKYIVCQSFKPYTFLDNKELINDNDFIELILWGKLNNCKHATQPYILHRDESTRVIESIKAGMIPVIYSHLGNGKTILLHEVCNELYSSYDIYFLNSSSEFFMDELTYIQQNKNTLIVIDNFNAFKSEIDIISQVCPHVNLIFTCRNTIYDYFYPWLYDKFKTRKFTRHDCNVLTTDDVSIIADTFDYYGLWGENKRKSKEWKINYLLGYSDTHNNLNGEYHSILLAIFKSPEIIKRIEYEIEKVKKNAIALEITIAIAILQSIFGKVDVSEIESIFGPNVLNSSMLSPEGALSSFINVRKSTISLCSSTMALFMLNMIAKKDILNILIKLHDSFSESAKIQYGEYRKDIQLVRFANVQLILKDKNDFTFLYKYYSTIKNRKLRNNDPLFWLQYATCCTEDGNFDMAEQFFKTARGCARSGWNHFQIDNREAIFLIKKSLVLEDYSTALPLLKKAIKLINKGFSEKMSDRIRKIIRPAALYADFWEQYYEDILANNAEKKSFTNAIFRAVKYIDALPDVERSHPEIETIKLKLLALKCLHEEI